MKIGIDIRPLAEAHPTGVGEYTRQIVEHVLAAAPADEFVLFAAGASPRSLRDLGIAERAGLTLHWLARPNKITSATTALVQQPLLDKRLGKIDVFFSPNFNFAALSANCPHVVTVHDLSFLLFPEFLTLKRRLWHQAVRAVDVVRAAAHVICDSVSTKRDIHVECGFRREHISVIPLGGGEIAPPSEAEVVAVLAKYKLQRPYIISVGTREPRKNLAALVEAYSLLREKLSEPVALVFVGPAGWKNADFLQALAASKYRADIKQLGFVSDRERSALIAGARVLAMVSSHEGFGLPLVEAMRSSVPVLTAQVSALPEVCGSAGMLVDPERTNAIAVALQELLRDEGLRSALIMRGRRQVKKFSWDQTAQATLQVLQSVAANTSAPLQGKYLPAVEVV